MDWKDVLSILVVISLVVVVAILLALLWGVPVWQILAALGIVALFASVVGGTL